jgi:hypothetical protein
MGCRLTETEAITILVALDTYRDEIAKHLTELLNINSKEKWSFDGLDYWTTYLDRIASAKRIIEKQYANINRYNR